jgi:hypothetical protein
LSFNLSARSLKSLEETPETSVARSLMPLISLALEIKSPL